MLATHSSWFCVTAESALNPITQITDDVEQDGALEVPAARLGDLNLLNLAIEFQFTSLSAQPGCV